MTSTLTKEQTKAMNKNALQAAVTFNSMPKDTYIGMKREELQGLRNKSCDLKSQIPAIEKAIAETTQRQLKLLPIEEQAHDILDQKIRDLGQAKYKLQEQQRYDCDNPASKIEEEIAIITNDIPYFETKAARAFNPQHCRNDYQTKAANFAKFSKEYAIFDPSCLSWLKTDLFPVFAIFTLNDGNCVIRCTSYTDDGYCWQLVTPEKAQSVFNPYMKENLFELPSALKKDQYQRFETRFSNIIPDATRDKIHKAQEQNLELFFIVEAKEWVKSPKPQKPSDPLLIGYDGKFFYLIDQFDTTPLEEFAATAFSIKLD